MLLVTFHGGKPSKSVPNPVNNVYAYKDSGGTPLETNVLKGAGDELKDAELRGLAWAYHHLYVANGRKDSNTILRFKGSGSKYDFTNVFASREGGSGQSGIDSIFHPYALTFDDTQYCYVSSQDTDVVSRLAVSDSSGKTGSAAPIPSGLPAGGTFFSGTFVACSQAQLPGLSATSPIATPQGLAVDIENGKVQHSVRDVVLTGGLIYVCDEAAGAVKVYDMNGNYHFMSNSVPSPAHLLLYNNQLYVSGGDAVMSAPLSSSALNFTVVQGVDGKGASGMVFNTKGDKFFVADRKKNEVHSYDVSSTGTFSNKKKIIQDMPDNPEFLYHLPG